MRFCVQDIEIEKKALAKEYKELLRISYQSLSKEDKKLIRKAFDYAVDAHQKQRRKSCKIKGCSFFRSIHL